MNIFKSYIKTFRDETLLNKVYIVLVTITTTLFLYIGFIAFRNYINNNTDELIKLLPAMGIMLSAGLASTSVLKSINSNKLMKEEDDLNIQRIEKNKTKILLLNIATILISKYKNPETLYTGEYYKEIEETKDKLLNVNFKYFLNGLEFFTFITRLNIIQSVISSKLSYINENIKLIDLIKKDIEYLTLSNEKEINSFVKLNITTKINYQKIYEYENDIIENKIDILIIIEKEIKEIVEEIKRMNTHYELQLDDLLTALKIDIYNYSELKEILPKYYINSYHYTINKKILEHKQNKNI